MVEGEGHTAAIGVAIMAVAAFLSLKVEAICLKAATIWRAVTERSFAYSGPASEPGLFTRVEQAFRPALSTL
jgi:hypothetical protein